MSIKDVLQGWTTPAMTIETHIPKFSTTGDILAFKRCRKQYGFFDVRGFASATNTQRYFGTLVHDVLDRINRNYQAVPTLPDHETIINLVDEAHERLIRSGIRPYNSQAQRQEASKIIERFVLLIGPHFFPHVQLTEYRLERALKTHLNRDYVLTGVVDVVSGAVSHSLKLPYSTMKDDIEIWDYKSGTMPDKNSQELLDYEYQMRVYAELYHQQTGEYPARSVLVFIGELGNDNRWAAAANDPAQFPKLIYPIHPTPRHIQRAMADFHQTVEDIMHEKSLPYTQQWAAPPLTHKLDSKTCEACELRYNCPYFENRNASRMHKERAEAL